MADKLGFKYEETPTGIRTGLEQFQTAVAAKERSLYVCREIANGSKHMRRNKSDPSVEAKAIWRKAIEGAGLVVPGNLLLSPEITDGTKTFDAVKWFIEAAGFWEHLFRAHGWISAGDRLPDKIIKPRLRLRDEPPPHSWSDSDEDKALFQIPYCTNSGEVTLR